MARGVLTLVIIAQGHFPKNLDWIGLTSKRLFSNVMTAHMVKLVISKKVMISRPGLCCCCPLVYNRRFDASRMKIVCATPCKMAASDVMSTSRVSRLELNCVPMTVKMLFDKPPVNATMSSMLSKSSE